MDREEIGRRRQMTRDDLQNNPRTGSTIIRLKNGRMDVETISKVFIDRLGMIEAEATKLCMQEGGILLDNLEPAVADGVAADLRAQGEDCFTVPAAELVPLPHHKQIHGLQWDQEQIGFLDSADRVEQAAWEKTVAIALAHVTPPADMPSVAPGVVAPGIVWHGAMDVDMGVGPHTRSVHGEEIHLVLDLVVLGPLRRYRIDAAEFDYGLLGQQRRVGDAENMRVLATWLLDLAKDARSNVTTQSLAAESMQRVPKLSPHGMDEVVHWLLNLAKFRPQQ